MMPNIYRDVSMERLHEFLDFILYIYTQASLPITEQIHDSLARIVWLHTQIDLIASPHLATERSTA